ncbi:hypothetical protein M3I01_006700 [Marinomonas sp. RSW2]|uniref:Lipoprotein n=1 Tax=Marinomonas maritima TaxID=2940935 RepID=A0ABT5WCT5_9GAMM|nr:hypothetical protein [Marinomonas maritima]MDE8602615.1 hypothetical protein [Marinomonas maritima]
MPTFRTGLLLASLLLSACSMPILQEFQPTQAEKTPTQDITTEKSTSTKNDLTELVTPVTDDTAKQSTSIEAATVVEKNDQLIEQFEAQKQLASTNFIELKSRIGNAPALPRLLDIEQLNKKEINSAIQQLRTYISKTNTDLAVLNARVDDRQRLAADGDLIRIFLSEATVTHNSNKFKAQPLVGQWVRGESRVIRLKDSILFENPRSEDLHITFSETYQLVVNNQTIATVNPHKEKNSASFSVSTHDNQGAIVGKLDYRIVIDK